jgi:hypothetical protein
VGDGVDARLLLLPSVPAAVEEEEEEAVRDCSALNA